MFSLGWFMFLSDRPGFLLLILDPNCSSPNILPYYQSNMTATSQGIGTRSVYPSVSKNKNRRDNYIIYTNMKKNCTSRCKTNYYYFKSMDSPNQFSLFLLNCFSNFSDATPKKNSVSKGARKMSVFLCVSVPFCFLLCQYIRKTSTIFFISLETCRIPELSVRNSS